MTTPLAVRSWRLALGAVLLLFVPSTAPAADPKSSVESLLTAETVGFLHVRIADVWESPAFAFSRKILASLGADELKALDGKFTPSPSQIESLTIIMPTRDIRMAIPDGRPNGDSMLWVITTKQPLERGELVKALGLETRTKAHRGTEYLFDEEHWAGIIQLEPTTLVIAAEDSIVRLIAQRETGKGKESPLARVFAREASKHSAVLAVNPPVLATKEFLKEFPEASWPLAKATSAWMALDLKQEARLSLAIEFATAEQTATGRKAVEALRKMFLDKIARGMKELQNDEAVATRRPVMGLLDMPSFFSPIVAKSLLKYVESSLKGLTVETKETTLQTTLNLSEFFPAHGEALTVLAFFAVSGGSSSSYVNYRGYDRDEIPYYLRDRFERLSAALQAYHADKGSFPPAALFDKAGKPLLSWRVLILPYLEQRPWENPNFGPRPPFKGPNDPALAKRTYADLYKQFKLDEPWDSLNNKKLLERMPPPYQAEYTTYNWRQRSDWKTGMQVFTGPGTLFPGREAVSRGHVRDGIETTIAIAFRDDLPNAVAWTKPLDMPFNPKRQLPKLLHLPPDHRGPTGPQAHGIFAIMADGQSRRFPVDFDERQFRGMITIDGGESVKLPERRKDPFQPKFNDPFPPFEKR